METIKLNKKQLKIIEPISETIIGYRSTLSDLAIMRGRVDTRLFRELIKMFPELKDKEYHYRHLDKSIKVD